MSRSWTPLHLLTSLEALELNALWAWNHTMQLSEFTSMCSQTSDGSFALEELIYSMSTVSTQTSHQAVELLRQDTTMQSRMVTLLQEGWQDRAEWEILAVRRNGIRSSMQRLETSFLRYAKSWILSVWCAHSAKSKSSPIGGSLWSRNPTLIPMEFLTLPIMETSKSGGIIFSLPTPPEGMFSRSVGGIPSLRGGAYRLPHIPLCRYSFRYGLGLTG